MARKLISFIGTTAYKFCNYYYENQSVSNVRFVQEALVDFFCTDWNSNDSILVFYTAESKFNWFGNEHVDGLKHMLENRNLNCNIEGFQIPTGTQVNSEIEEINNSIWGIFNEVFSHIDNDDKIIFDTTYAFRYIPMLGLVLLNYAKFLRNIEIEGIYYGAIEVIDFKMFDSIPIEKRNAPIINLINFATLQDWTAAANEFISFGNAKNLTTLIRKLPQNEELNDFVQSLTNFTNSISTVRGKNIIYGQEALALKDAIAKIKTKANFALLSPIFDKVSEKIEVFEINEILNGINAAYYCFKHDMIQPAITLLQESILTYLLFKLNYDWEDRFNRSVLSSCLSVPRDRFENKERSEPNKTKVENLVNSIYHSEYQKEYYRVYRRLNSKIRNDINHSGLGVDSKDADEIISEYKVAYNLFVQKINEVENKQFPLITS